MNKIVLAGVFVILVVGAAFLAMRYGAPVTLAKEEAVRAVIDMHPELAAYQTTSLPPSSIETKQAADGWYVAFIQRGSGLPGILHAQCYHVSGNKSVAATGQYDKEANQTADTINFENCSPVYATGSSATTTPTPSSTVLPFGNVTLKLNQIAQFKDISIKPISIEEDSRCPSDVQCIQAGTVRVKIEVSAGMGKSTSIVKLDQLFTTEGEAITLTNVLPGKNSKVTIHPSDYSLTFNVIRQGTKPPTTSGKCYVGGCSAQLCSDQPDMVSTCEYTAAYGCYKTATCARQSSGQCGWTPSAALSACLANAKTAPATDLPQ
jgi:hypothetical protein